MSGLPTEGEVTLSMHITVIEWVRRLLFALRAPKSDLFLHA